MTYMLYYGENIEIIVTLDEDKKRITRVNLSQEDSDDIWVNIDIDIEDSSMTGFGSSTDEESIKYSEKAFNTLKVWMIKCNITSVDKLLEYLKQNTRYYTYLMITERNILHELETRDFLVHRRYLGYGHLEYEDGTKSETGFLYSNLHFNPLRKKLEFTGLLKDFKSDLIVLDGTNIGTLYFDGDSSNQTKYPVTAGGTVTFVPDTMEEFKQDIEEIGLSELLEG